jgi:hypothetical protein
MIEFADLSAPSTGPSFLKEEKIMPQFFLTDLNPVIEDVDLGNSSLKILNDSATAVQIFVDYKLNGNWTNAFIHGGPFTLPPADMREVRRQELLSEHVRLGVAGNNFRVSVLY